MRIEIANEADAKFVAKASGFESVEAYVNKMIKEAYDLEAIKEGVAAADAGRVTPLAEFDREFRKEMGFAPRHEG